MANESHRAAPALVYRARRLVRSRRLRGLDFHASSTQARATVDNRAPLANDARDRILHSHPRRPLPGGREHHHSRHARAKSPHRARCPVVWAVRMSMSIPLRLAGSHLAGGLGALSRPRPGGARLVDGGLLSNFPIELFISAPRRSPSVMGPKQDAPVLGIDRRGTRCAGRQRAAPAKHPETRGARAGHAPRPADRHGDHGARQEVIDEYASSSSTCPRRATARPSST